MNENNNNGGEFKKVELTLTLPFDMAVEQVELQILNTELFNKCLRVYRIERLDSQNTDDDNNVIHLRGGFYD